MRKLFFHKIFYLSLACLCAIAHAQEAPETWMPDANLRAAVQEATGRVNFTRQDLQRLEHLDLKGRGISDITGLEHATNLRDLAIGQNPITDLSPLSNLRQLVRLGFWQIPTRSTHPDLSPLANLLHLEDLWLQGIGITDISPLAGLVNLRSLYISHNAISDASPLAGLRNLRVLAISQNPISDISALANLRQLVDLGFWHDPARPSNLNLSLLANLLNLEVLSLSGNGITDITPLARLENLRYLHIVNNHIADFSPLAGLTNLRELWIKKNWTTDVSMLTHLNLTTFEYDEFCIFEPLAPSVADRIKNRSFPSIALPGSSLVNENSLGWLAWDDDREHYYDLAAKHDLAYFGNIGRYKVTWHLTSKESTELLSTRISGDLSAALSEREQYNQRNPNFIFLPGTTLHLTPDLDSFPPDSDLWLRDADGQIMKNYQPWDEYLLNILNPDVQQLLIDRIVAVAECGLYDGVLIDDLLEHGLGYWGDEYIGTDEEVIDAHAAIFAGVRARVREDFLMVANANITKLTHYAAFLNGGFMEIGDKGLGGYTHERLMEIEDTLLWNQANLREPQVTILQGGGVPEAVDSPTNLRWMRVFTTMSLTLSDGYSIYRVPHEIGGYIQGVHIWYDFWDAPLGQPVGERDPTLRNTERRRYRRVYLFASSPTVGRFTIDPVSSG